MSNTYWYSRSQAMFYSSDTGFGTLLKSLITYIVNNDPNLEVHSVVTDTTSVYKVYLRISGTNGGFHLYNSSDRVYYKYGAWNDAGTWVNKGNDASNVLYNGYEHYAVCFGYGNCYCGFQFGSTYSVYSNVCARYATFTSDSTDGLQAATICWADTARPIARSSAFDSGSLSWLNPTSGTLESVYGSSSIVGATALVRAEYMYAWVPYWEHLYTLNMGMVNVKWGGSYKAKVVCYNGGVMSSTPGTQVLVDGETITVIDSVLKFE